MKKMIVEGKTNEILVRFLAGFSPSRIQSILVYLRFDELASKLEGTGRDLDSLLKGAKKERFINFKNEMGLNI